MVRAKYFGGGDFNLPCKQEVLVAETFAHKLHIGQLLMGDNEYSPSA